MDLYGAMEGGPNCPGIENQYPKKIYREGEGEPPCVITILVVSQTVNLHIQKLIRQNDQKCPKEGCCYEHLLFEAKVG